jgi:hypothetical protein
MIRVGGRVSYKRSCLLLLTVPAGSILCFNCEFLGLTSNLAAPPAMEITKYRSQLFIALERAGVHLRQVQHTLTKLQRNIVDRSRGLREVLLPNAIFENHLWNLLRRGQITLTGWGRSVTDKPRGLWEALRARENDVASSAGTEHAHRMGKECHRQITRIVGGTSGKGE